MRVKLVVVLEPFRQRADDGGRPLRFGVRPAARSATFERATPIVSQTVFIANRPWAETATATSVFLTLSRYRALLSESHSPASSCREDVATRGFAPAGRGTPKPERPLPRP